MRKLFLSAQIAAWCGLSLLQGCASVPASAPPREVQVQVPISCVSQTFPKKPEFTDDPISLLATDMPGRYGLLAENYKLHQAWEAALEKQLKDCQ